MDVERFGHKAYIAPNSKCGSWSQTLKLYVNRQKEHDKKTESKKVSESKSNITQEVQLLRKMLLNKFSFISKVQENRTNSTTMNHAENSTGNMFLLNVKKFFLLTSRSNHR